MPFFDNKIYILITDMLLIFTDQENKKYYYLNKLIAENYTFG